MGHILSRNRPSDNPGTLHKAGDPISVVAHPNKAASKLVLLFYAIKADGTRLYRAAHQYDGEKE
jgi:hypothetical protein